MVHDNTDLPIFLYNVPGRTLPENYRNAIYLHYYEGYTAAEIGQMMAVPTNTVLSWLRRARAQLHTMLKEEIEDEVV